jgi:DNA-binding NarL/FixJ family response regulator
MSDAGLTQLQRYIADSIARGEHQRPLAHELKMQRGELRVQVKAIYSKTGTSNPEELARWLGIR